MKKVLISIHPRWCAEIFNGQKTIEVRKSFPRQLETPFEVLVYCTKGKENEKMCFDRYSPYIGNGKVIGEFVCDKIEKIEFQAQCSSTLSERWMFNRIAKQACLTAVDMSAYLNGDNGYGWHITAPTLFDKPKELSEFRKVCLNGKCSDCIYEECKITRPPQSWCYVEKLQ